MYTDPDFKTKKALKEAVAQGKRVRVFQPSLGTVPKDIAKVSVEGPHYPKSHSWYARVQINRGMVVRVLG